jgi:hypothetical protein
MSDEPESRPPDPPGLPPARPPLRLPGEAIAQPDPPPAAKPPAAAPPPARPPAAPPPPVPPPAAKPPAAAPPAAAKPPARPPAPAPHPAAPPPRPAPAPKPAPQAAAKAEAPKPPGFGEFFEQSLLAPFQPAVFARAALRPAPSFGTSLGLALTAGAAAEAVQFVYAAISRPGFLQSFPPPLVAAVGVAALGVYGSLFLLAAVLFYGLGNALGGKADFDRGLQAAAAVSLLIPVQMLCNWFPLAWVLPALVAAWTAAGALEGLFGARRGPVRAMCAVLALFAIGLQAGARLLSGRAVEAARPAVEAAQDARAAADLQRQMEEFQRNVSPVVQPAAGAPSSLDLLRGPEGETPADAGAPAGAVAPPATPEQASERAHSLDAGAVGMLDALKPILNNPALMKNLPPQARKDLVELQALMDETRAQAASGRQVSDAEQNARMRRIQQLTMHLMTSGLMTPPPPPARTKPMPHLVPSDKLPPPGGSR